MPARSISCDIPKKQPKNILPFKEHFLGRLLPIRHPFFGFEYDAHKHLVLPRDFVPFSPS